MDLWRDLVIGTLVVAPELEAFVLCVGAMYLLEVATQVVALLGGMRR